MEILKKFKNQPRPLVRPSSVYFCWNFWNLSHATIPLSCLKCWNGCFVLCYEPEMCVQLRAMPRVPWDALNRTSCRPAPQRPWFVLFPGRTFLIKYKWKMQKNPGKERNVQVGHKITSFISFAVVIVSIFVLFIRAWSRTSADCLSATMRSLRANTDPDSYADGILILWRKKF